MNILINRVNFEIEDLAYGDRIVESQYGSFVYVEVSIIQKDGLKIIVHVGMPLEEYRALSLKEFEKCIGERIASSIKDW